MIIVFFAVFALFVVVGTTPVVPLVAGNETMQYSSCFSSVTKVVTTGSGKSFPKSQSVSNSLLAK